MCASIANNPEPIPDKVRATWITQDWKTHERTVEVASHVPDVVHFEGSICYRFADGGVSVIPVTYIRQEQNVREGKPAVP